MLSYSEQGRIPENGSKTVDHLALDHRFLEERLVALYALVTERRQIERLESPVNDAMDSRMVAEIEEVVGGAGFDAPR
ncbi:hypothetical protein [Mesorhizobium sp. M0618]|uniref:hypothetical protein n=1 Tax=unclassified Mesorhizobium TaxID=325217 RepID=UPI003336493B